MFVLAIAKPPFSRKRPDFTSTFKRQDVDYTTFLRMEGQESIAIKGDP